MNRNSLLNPISIYSHPRCTTTVNRGTVSRFDSVLLCPCGPGQHSEYSDSLRAGRYGDRIPVGARFSAPVQTDPEAHPASCTIGTGSFPGVKRPGRDVDHPPPSSDEVTERVNLYLYSTSGHSWPAYLYLNLLCPY